jgi:hypothetical protein
MTNTPPEAFVYIWTDNSIIDGIHHINKRYIGVHKGTSDGFGYVCSSQYAAEYAVSAQRSVGSEARTLLTEYAARPQYFTRRL